MRPTRQLHQLGQSLWLDNITRDLLSSGTLERYIDELSVTGLTSNPTIFEQALKSSSMYEGPTRELADRGLTGEELFFELALQDITAAADALRPIWERTVGLDGYVSLEVSPLLARDAKASLAAARDLHARAGRPNVMIKIPGTPEGLPAIEEAIFAGVPVNVTLLFSREHYVAAFEAWLTGVERRIEAGLNPDVASVASLFVSRWDKAVLGKVPEALRARLGIAISQRTYRASRELLGSPRWLRAANAGARPQRLLWASTSTKDPQALPEATLKAWDDHGRLGEPMAADGGDCEEVLARFAEAGVDDRALAARLQQEGEAAFVSSWNALLEVIGSRTDALGKAR
jgi:transaldolase